MKIIKNLLTVLSVCMLFSFAGAQGNCQGDNIRVYKGASGCGCKCIKECVTPAELPLYLANGWNTEGCWNCCWAKNWVEAETPNSSLDEVRPNAEPGSLSVSFKLASKSNVKISVTDMTGRHVATLTDGYREDLENELIWDNSKLEPGMYLLQLQSGEYSETKKVNVME